MPSHLKQSRQSIVVRHPMANARAREGPAVKTIEKTVGRTRHRRLPRPSLRQRRQQPNSRQMPNRLKENHGSIVVRHPMANAGALRARVAKTIAAMGPRHPRRSNRLLRMRRRTCNGRLRPPQQRRRVRSERPRLISRRHLLPSRAHRNAQRQLQPPSSPLPRRHRPRRKAPPSSSARTATSRTAAWRL